MKYLFEQTLDSTNDFAKRWLKENTLSESVCIQSNYQTHGRGQGNHSWSSSSESNILLSIIHPWINLDVAYHFNISRCVTLGIINFLEQFDITGKIKWPNDIYVKHQKLAGILIENTLSNNQIQSSIIGIGLNVNQTVFDLSLPNPTSLKQIRGKDLDIPQISRKLIDCIAKHLENINHAEVHKAYDDKLYLKGQDILIQEQKSVWAGKIISTLEDGRIKLKNKKGETKIYAHGEASLIRKES